MSRKGTSNLNLGTYTDGENPGAGSQDVDNTGLNGNWIKIDTAVGTDHTTAGAHKSAVIDGANLKSTVADGSTIVQDGGTKKLGIPASGITATQLAADAVETAKIKNANVTTAKLATGAVTANELAMDSVSTVKIQDGAVTAAKLASGVAGGSGYMLFGDERVAAAGAGNAVAAITEWQETSATAFVKISVMYYYRSTDKYIRLRANAKNTNTKGWRVELSVGATTVVQSGVNTSYDLTTYEVFIDVDVEAIFGAMIVPTEVTIALRANSTPTTAYLTNVNLMVVPS
jgi:hypothetical protein